MAITQRYRIYPRQASVPRNQANRPVNVPAPVGGWNTREQLAGMAPTDAVELINMVPKQGYCEMRGGFGVHSYLESNTAAQADDTSYLDGGNITDFNFGVGQDFTIEFLMEHPGTSVGVMRIAGKRTGSGAGWSIQWADTSENVSLTIDDGTNEVSASLVDACPNDGVPHHIAFVVEHGVEITAYVDGEEDTSSGSPFDISTVTGSLSSGTTVFRIFADENASGATHWDSGIIDEFRVWNDLRTAAEIRDNRSSEVAADASLIAYWKMQGLVGSAVTTITDDSSNSWTLTKTGGGSMSYIDFTDAFDRVADVDFCEEFYDGSTRQLIAATATNVYNVTATGTATSLGSGFTTGRWDSTMFNGTMGLVNGSDAPQTYDGTTLGAMTVSGSGLTVTNLVGIHAFKNRTYFWEADQQRFWYSAVNTLGGTLTEFALGEVIETGGKLTRITSWTVDGGAGPDDYFVAAFDSGEIAVYQGDNPGSALSWGLVGKYEIGAIANSRGFTKLGGQVAVITESDLVTLPQAFSTPSPPTTKLSGAISRAVRSFGATPDGWEIYHYKSESLLFINVPVALSPDRFEQYALNLETGSACRFTNINARTWGSLSDDVYFGSTDGKVYRYDGSFSDDGEDIDVTIQHAWTSFGIPNYKKITGVRPVFESSSSIPVGTAVGGDYTDAESVASPSSSVTSGTPWGSPWGSPWGAISPGIYREWKLASGRGTTISLLTKFSRQGDKPKLLNTDTLIMPGGNL